MSEVLLMCLMVLVVISNTSGHWTKKSEEDPKDLKNEKENMKEVFAHWQENSQNKRFTTTTSTSTMPPTTTPKKIQLNTAIDEREEIKKEMRKERKESIEQLRNIMSKRAYHEMRKIKEEMRKERKEELEKNKKEMVKYVLCVLYTI